MNRLWFLTGCVCICCIVLLAIIMFSIQQITGFQAVGLIAVQFALLGVTTLAVVGNQAK